MRLATTLTATLLLALAFVGATEARAQSRAASDFWTDVAAPALARSAEEAPLPAAYRALRLDLGTMAERLAEAPLETVPGNLSGAVEIPLPLPDGSFEWYRVIEAPVMEPGLQARYPQMRSYLGQSIETPAATVRLSLTPHGFAAMAMRPGGTVFIDPYAKGETEHYLAYFRADARPHPSLYEVGPDVVIDEIGHDEDIRELLERGPAVENGNVLRTYRLAVAATGEYTIYHSADSENPTVEEGLAAIVVAMTRINGVYEREVAVRMLLVENNHLIVYTDPDTDPYSNNNTVAMLGQNQSNLDQVIGSANYDIGHVFSTAPGGVATLGSVCRNGQKARGVTGLPAPTGDRFHVDYVSHEMGHQFRGNHTFNSSIQNCLSNRNAGTAYEPGSGTTILSYAGLCGTHNTQGNSDDYFHNITLTEITGFIAHPSLGGSCAVEIETDNEIPQVSAQGGYTIPVSTPFVLEGEATDDTPESLTYTWEGMNLGAASAPPGSAAYNNMPPFFRTYAPSTEPVRYFPKLDYVLHGYPPFNPPAGNYQHGEGLPIDARQLRFRFTARDNHPGAGAIRDVQITINTDAGAGPFAVTFANEPGLEFTGGSEQVVTWDVAGTGLYDEDGNESTNNVKTEFVTILLSDNGGESFDYVLAEEVPNDGAATVVMPNIDAEEARVMVRAVGNIFFAVNDEEFAITQSVSTEAAPEAGFALSPVYPNPLGAASSLRGTLNLSVAEAQHVEVALFDALGRRVRELFSGPMASGHNRQLTLSASGLAGGVYFVRVSGETFSEVRTFTVVR